ncbi:MAG: copper homeostasis protein CutC [Phycisphaerales bacterium]|nr:copper homeostasis protein CutC [Phycisphaerales bacterium]
MRPTARVEIAVEDLAGARAAAAAGAHRIELCASLLTGGLTPSLGCLQVVRKSVAIEVACMIRPRGGDFVYSDDELEAMVRDIGHARDAGADGVVLGCLSAAGRIDRAGLQRLVAAAGRLPVTFHRAFDAIADPDAALGELADLGVARLLSSGGARTAEAGAEALTRLMARAGSTLIVMPGGGVRSHNAAAIVRATGAFEIHSGAGGPVGGDDAAPGVPGTRWHTDAAEVGALVRAVGDA